MIQGRAYQTEAVSSIYSYFQKNATGNPLIAMPTGTGKSVVIALFLHSIYMQWASQKVLVLTHVKELIEQNYAKLISLWPEAPAGIYSSGLNRRDVLQRIIFAGIASVAKRADLFGHVDLILIDEAHLVSPSEATMYRTFLAALLMINPQLRIVGFTATAYRLGYGKITEGEEALFTDICFDICGMEAFNRLIAEGYLAPLVSKRTKTMLDLDGVHMRGGEFISKELQQAVNKDDVTRAAIEEAMQYQHERHCWLTFCAGVEHAIDTADIMNDMGIRTVAIHSKMKAGERDDAIAGFKSGYYTAATNNNVLTTGFDHPPIDLILMLRPTASTPLWVQMLGRGTRPYDFNKPGDVDPVAFPYVKRNCRVLDFSGNVRRLGPINDPVIPRKPGQGGGDAPVKLCGKCDCWVHASLRFCNTEHDDGTICNEEFVFTTKLNTSASSAEIMKGDMPVTEVFKVDHLTYTSHHKQDKPSSLRVTYYSGLRKFDEYVCPLHDGWAFRKAAKWWSDRTSAPMPGTIEGVLETVTNLSAPTHIRVWTNKTRPEIMAFCFDGSEFGKLPPGTVVNPEGAVSGGKDFSHLMRGAAAVVAQAQADRDPEVDEDGEAYGF